MKPEFSECRAVHTCVSSHCHDREIGAALEALICSWPFNQRMVQITPHLSSGLFPSTLPQLLLFLLFIYAVSFWTKISVKLLWGHFYLSPSQEAAYISEPLELNQVSESQWTANKSEAKACLRPRTAPPLCLTLEWISWKSVNITHKCHILNSPDFISFLLKWGVAGRSSNNVPK